MADFQVKDPDTAEVFVVDAADRARLLSRGYEDVTTEPPKAEVPPFAQEPKVPVVKPGPEVKKETSAK